LIRSTGDLTILVFGQLDSPEMETVRKDLMLSGVKVIPGSLQAATPLDPDQFPDLIIVCQQWPDEYSSRQVHGLLVRHPLARLLCCYGPWCDSDGRNRDIWPAGSRVPVSGFRSRLDLETALLLGLPGAAVLPLTASRTEVFELQFAMNVSPPIAGRFAVVSPDCAWRGMLESGLRTAGGQVVPVADASVILFDLDPDTPEQLATMSTLECTPPCTVVALVGLCTSDIAARAQRHGASAVGSKLLPLSSLLETIVFSMKSTTQSLYEKPADVIADHE